MKNVIKFIKLAIAFVVGLNFWGFGLLGMALILFLFMGSFFNPFGWIFIGVFIGKNMQAIKDYLRSIEW